MVIKFVRKIFSHLCTCKNTFLQMELNKKFKPLEILGSENSKTIKYGAAIVESLNAQNTFYYNINMNKVSVQQKPGMPQVASVNVNVADFAWEKVR